MLEKQTADDWRDLVDAEVDRSFEQLVQLRRHLHQFPELSGEEKETSLLLYTQLGNEGFEVRLAQEGIGVLADWGSSDDLPILALRADLDALPIEDKKQVAYRSQREGVMHACGHDVHTTVVRGALQVLKRLADQQRLPWGIRVRGVFQPAEETCQGALRMINSGALEGVSTILATHVDPSIAIGRIGMRDGVLTASCDEVLIEIQGSGGHAARPHESKDPISAAAQLINALYLYIPRVTDSQDAVVITIGNIVGGRNSNVIPERVELKGTIRTLNADVRDKAKNHIKRIADGVAATSETRINVSFGVSSPSVVNDPAFMGLLRQIARQLFGESSVHEIPRPSMGSEDFAFYLEQIPGAMVRLGAAGPRAEGRALHTPTFDVDEDVIRIGTCLLARTVIDWFRPEGQG